MLVNDCIKGLDGGTVVAEIVGIHALNNQCLRRQRFGVIVFAPFKIAEHTLET